MKTLTVQEKRKSQRVPIELLVLGEREDGRLEMYTDNISLEGMFLFSRDFIRPHATFCARIWLPTQPEPLLLYLTACFIERTCAGYGIGAQIAEISAADSILWESFYRSCAVSRAEQLRQLVQSERTARHQRVLVLDGAVSPLAIQTMGKLGLEILHAASVEEAIVGLQQEHVDVVISDLVRPGVDGLLLCKYVNEQRLPTHTVMLTSSAAPKAFLQGIQAAATRVIAKPCSNELLVTRILDVLQQRLPSGRAWPVASSDASYLSQPLTHRTANHAGVA